MTRTNVQTRRARAALVCALAPLALAGAFARPGAAQGGPAPDKAAAVRSLLEASAARKHAAGYQKNWPDGVIAGYRQKRLFDSLTPGP